MRAAKVASPGQPASAVSSKPKVLHAVRHGITEMNVYLRTNPYNPDFAWRDPLKYDTVLTPEGIEGARKAAKLAAQLGPQPEVLVVSPMSRTLHTADLVFEHYTGPRVVEALARERLWLASDIGSHPDELRKNFNCGKYDFDELDDIWWHNGGSSDPKAINPESDEYFQQRIEDLKAYLLSRPEEVIGLVAHWGVLKELTGHSFTNCEIKTFSLCEKEGVNEVRKPLSFSWPWK